MDLSGRQGVLAERSELAEMAFLYSVILALFAALAGGSFIHNISFRYRSVICSHDALIYLDVIP